MVPVLLFDLWIHSDSFRKQDDGTQTYITVNGLSSTVLETSELKPSNSGLIRTSGKVQFAANSNILKFGV